MFCAEVEVLHPTLDPALLQHRQIYLLMQQLSYSKSIVIPIYNIAYGVFELNYFQL